MKPIAFLSEIFDLVHITRSSYSKDGFLSSKFSTHANACLHEDGGIYAVYEQYEQVALLLFFPLLISVEC